MAQHVYYFIGPYAEWLISESREDAIPDEDWERVLDGGALEWNIGADQGFLIRRGRAVSRRYCAMPRARRAGCPRKPMLLEWDLMNFDVGKPEFALDWTGIDPQAELGWFQKAFAPELEEAAQVLGKPALFRWGLVHWYIP